MFQTTIPARSLVLKSTTKTPKRPLWTVLPEEFQDAHLNGCRTPGCRNFGVRPVVVPGFVDPNYRVEKRSKVDALVCTACTRRFAIYAVRAYALELDRIENRNGALFVPSCPKEDCPSFGKPLTSHPKLYGCRGTTSAGRRRHECKRCRSTFVFEDDHRAMSNKHLLKTQVRFMMNSVPLRGQPRIANIEMTEIYRRLPFIWRKFVQFEEYKLQRFFAMKKNADMRIHLCTDGQDQLVNWWSKDRRDPVQLSCITTADNLSGFILRTDLNYDASTGNAAEHFEQLVADGDYALPPAKSLNARYEAKAFLKAVIWNLAREIESLPASSRRCRQLMGLMTQAELLLGSAEKEGISSVSGSPPNGVVVKRNYTAVAHLTALHRLLPPAARLHVSTDRDATLIAAALMAFRDRIADNRVDLTVVSFDKDMSVDIRQSRIKRYRSQLAAFKERSNLSGAAPAKLRQAFIAAHALELPPYAGIQGKVWSVPVQTLYEPDKCVGVVVQRSVGDPEHAGRHLSALLDRASLHATDTFFNFTRSRISYMTRGSDTKGSSGTYAPRRPYRPDLLQMTLDIARVYYNWCEPRTRRRAVDAEGLFDVIESPDGAPASGSAARSADAGPTTPAMRLGIARAPTRMDTILYGNWLK